MFSKKFIPLVLSAAVAAGISGCQTSNSDNTETNDTADSAHDNTHDATTAHWSYSGDTGPTNWHTISSDYAACQAGNTLSNDFSGTHQSPVDFNGTASAVTLGLSTPGALDFERHNNGHTIQLDESSTAGDATITIDSITYTLAQFHFHAGSEHTDHGTRAPMEVHFVFANEDDPAAVKYAVVGVLIDQGSTSNAELAKALAGPLPAEGESDATPIQVIVDQIITDGSNAYRYNGSFTTPPCTEDVEWTVLESHVTLTAEDIGRFTALYNGNYRPITGTLN